MTLVSIGAIFYHNNRNFKFNEAFYHDRINSFLNWNIQTDIGVVGRSINVYNELTNLYSEDLNSCFNKFSCTSKRVRKNCRKTCDVCRWLYDITFSNFVL